MFNYKLLEKIVIDDVKPNIILKYLLFKEIIIKDVALVITEYIFKSLEEIDILYKDINIIHHFNIIILKLLSSITFKKIDFVKHGLNSIVDLELDKILFFLLQQIHNPNTKTFDFIDHFYVSKELELIINQQYHLYYNEYADIINNVKHDLISALKSNSKYLDFIKQSNDEFMLI